MLRVARGLRPIPAADRASTFASKGEHMNLVMHLCAFAYWGSDISFSISIQINAYLKASSHTWLFFFVAVQSPELEPGSDRMRM